MFKCFLYIWQLPQHLLALGLLLVCRYDDVFLYKGTKIYTCSWIYGGLSLGKYLFVEYPTPLTIRHEYGHFKQSLMLGPLYLVLVGLWSIIRAGLNLYRNGQYYNGYPENWADKLGGVFINEQGRRDAVL